MSFLVALAAQAGFCIWGVTIDSFWPMAGSAAVLVIYTWLCVRGSR